jgi:CheY-like chemotaxis protein/HPt (histidine-containing phosphotransfer) domain-containing protein
MITERMSCSPCGILSDVASAMRVRALAKNVQFHVHNAPPIPQTILTDPTRLRQILLNLVGNALKFTERGSVRLEMKIERPDDGSGPYARFDIIDTGIGMTKEEMSRLFRPFVQADQSTTRRFGGTGLGLTISRHLARLLGGDIEVVSQPGVGSTFTLRIETGSLDNTVWLGRCEESMIENERADEGNNEFSSPWQVLLVDDGIHNQNVLTAYLRKAGASVTQASNGKIGVRMALEAMANGSRFDIILMDMQMPVMDGYEATRILRANAYSGPIIALTAHAMSGDREKCLRAGCTEYLSKPVKRNTLLATIAKLMAASPASSELDAPQIDADIEPYYRKFLAELPGQIVRLTELLNQANLSELEARIHALRGTAGLFGMDAVSEMAGYIEDSIRSGSPIEACQSQIVELIDMLRVHSVKAFSDESTSGNSLA